jgi:hypothetical protein
VLVGDHLLLRKFGPYGIIFMNICCCIRCHGNVVQGYGPYDIIFMKMYFYNRCHGNVVQGFGPYGIIFTNVRIVITVAMVMLLKDSGLHGIIINDNVCSLLHISRHS